MNNLVKWLMLAGLAGVIGAPMPCAASWDDGLIAYYNFEDPANIARDASGNGFDGKVVGFAHPMPKGAKGGAAFIEGIGSHIVVEALSNQVWGSELTVGLWFFRSDEFAWYSVLAGAGSSVKGSWDIRLGRQMEGKMLGCGVATYLDRELWDVTDVEAATKQWHHVVMTYDGGEVLMYLDDVIHEGDGDDQGAIVDLHKPLYLGGTAEPDMPGPTRSEHLTGMLDEVLVYNRVLSRAEISALFRKEHVIAGLGALKAARMAEAAAAPATPAAEEAVLPQAETPAPAVEETTKAVESPVAPAVSPTPDAAAILSQEALYCCEKLQQLTREWEKGNTQKVMGMLDELTGGR